MNNKLVKIGLGIFLALVIWSFISPKEEQLDLSNQSEPDNAALENGITPANPATQTLASNQLDKLDEDAFDPVILEEQEESLDLQEQSLLAKLSNDDQLASLGLVDSLNFEANDNQLETSSNVQEMRASVNLKELNKQKRVPQVKESDSKSESKMISTETPIDLNRRVYLFNDNYDVEEITLNINAQSREEDEKLLDESELQKLQNMEEF